MIPKGKDISPLAISGSIEYQLSSSLRVIYPELTYYDKEGKFYTGDALNKLLNIGRKENNVQMVEKKKEK